MSFFNYLITKLVATEGDGAKYSLEDKEHVKNQLLKLFSTWPLLN